MPDISRPILLSNGSLLKITDGAMSDESEDQWFLEHKDGHSKFYEVTIKVQGNSFILVTRHGRIGTKGRVIELPDRPATLEKARYLAQQVVKKKLDKGYKQVKKTVAKPRKEEEETSRFSKMWLE